MMRHDLVAVVFAAIALATGCQAATNEPAAAPERSVTREEAVASARQDAYLRYGAVAAGEAQVQRRGVFWVVELHRPEGGGLSYAISAQDGSIRQRSTFQ